MRIDAPQRPPPVDYADFEESPAVEGAILQEPLAVYDEVRQEGPTVVFEAPPPDDECFDRVRSDKERHIGTSS